MVPARIRRVATVLAAAGLGLVAAESLLTFTKQSELNFSAGSRPGYYCRDAKLGVSAACPGRQAVMRVPTSQIHARYALNQHGYRGPFRSPASADARRPAQIYMIGGVSQSYGAGLDDRDTIPAASARRLCAPATVHNFAFPGVDNAVAWRIYQWQSAALPAPDLIILSIYARNLPRLPDPAVVTYRRSISQMVLVQDWLHKNYGLGDNLLTRTNLFVGFAARVTDGASLFREQVVRRLRPDAVTGPVALPPERLEELRQVAISNFREFLREIQAYAERTNSAAAILFLPWLGKKLVADSTIRSLVPEGMAVIDAEADVISRGVEREVLPDAHYNAKQAAVIGQSIAAWANQKLGCRPEAASRPGQAR